jgi:two-component system, chemotaxis family, protein-glutamate methylesterase/glutaminase
MAGGKIRTLLIEDSAFMRILITDLLRAAPDIELVGAAGNGKEGVEKTLSLRPDVVITDMVMPQYDGLYAVRSIMKQRPTPIILLSSLERNDAQVFEALEAGAFDFVEKPRGDLKEGIRKSDYRLTELVRAAAHSKAAVPGARKGRKNTHAHVFSADLHYRIIVIGASTGGPGAVEQVVKQLPVNLALPVVIAQHMPPSFIDSFARRLDLLTPLKVRVATANEVLEAGTIYLAPGHANMEVERSPVNGNVNVCFTDRVYREFNFPSIDCLMESVARVYGSAAMGVVLTGMGKDGTEGLMAMKNSGGLTLVQDEESCVVYGMPKAAWDAGAARHQIRLKEIPGFIISCF